MLSRQMEDHKGHMDPKKHVLGKKKEGLNMSPLERYLHTPGLLIVAALEKHFSEKETFS